MDDFEAYGMSHLVVIGLLLAGAVAFVRGGRALRGSDAEARWGRLFAVALVAFTVPLHVLAYARAEDPVGALPLQLCDLASVAAPYALWTHHRWAVGLTYYWGLTLTTQAVITPDLSRDFPDPVFIAFWGMHVLVVWAACYLTWGLGLAPRWRDYGVAILATATWAVCVFGFNTVAGTNYGYLNAKPRVASALDLLGDWPWYVLAEVAIVVVVWALLTWPWEAAARRGVSPTRPPARRVPGR